ncbi:MAG: MoaD/ThiS family protein [Planctomycetales bacterium]
MTTTFQVPRVLRQYGDGKDEFRLSGETVRDLLLELNRKHPQLYGCICNETGSVRQHINLFVNDDCLCKQTGLDTPLEPGDVVSVFTAVSGG